MRQTPVRLGPLALLLAVISICLTILSILSFATARADLRLAEKYAQTVSERYALESEGQQALRELDGALRSGGSPAGFASEDGLWRRTIERGGARLSIAVEPLGTGEWRIAEWRHDRAWDEDLELGSLWSGV